VAVTVTACILGGNDAAREDVLACTRVVVRTFRGHFVFTRTWVVFLRTGLGTQVGALPNASKAMLVAHLAVMVRGVLFAYAMTAIARHGGDRIAWSWGSVLPWAWPRGSLSMVLVLSASTSLPTQDLLVTMTFGKERKRMAGSGRGGRRLPVELVDDDLDHLACDVQFRLWNPGEGPLDRALDGRIRRDVIPASCGR